MVRILAENEKKIKNDDGKTALKLLNESGIKNAEIELILEDENTTPKNV